jgi:hypothetical protein
MGLEFEEGTDSIGRFDIEERTARRLRLVARSRTQSFAMQWGRWPAALVLLLLCAWGAVMNPIAPSFFIGFGGITYAIIVMSDFPRVATRGVFSTVERSFVVESSSSESYRENERHAYVVVDGRAMSSPVRDVHVLCESVFRSEGQETCRVYVILEDQIITLETTGSRVTALRLAGLVRASAGLSPLAGTGGAEIPAGTGCLWSVLFYVVATIAPFVVAPLPTLVTSIGAKVACAGLLVVGLVVLEHLFALPMRRAVRAHIRKNFAATVRT